MFHSFRIEDNGGYLSRRELQGVDGVGGGGEEDAIVLDVESGKEKVLMLGLQLNHR